MSLLILLIIILTPGIAYAHGLTPEESRLLLMTFLGIPIAISLVIGVVVHFLTQKKIIKKRTFPAVIGGLIGMILFFLMFADLQSPAFEYGIFSSVALGTLVGYLFTKKN